MYSCLSTKSPSPGQPSFPSWGAPASSVTRKSFSQGLPFGGLKALWNSGTGLSSPRELKQETGLPDRLPCSASWLLKSGGEKRQWKNTHCKKKKKKVTVLKQHNVLKFEFPRDVVVLAEIDPFPLPNVDKVLWKPLQSPPPACLGGLRVGGEGGYGQSPER